MAAYSFEETSGTTTADGSGKGNTGTVSGATRTASGKAGRALSFDGVNDVVNIPDSTSLDLTTGLTLEAWVFPTAASDWRTVVMKEISGELSYALYANEDVATSSAYLRIGGTSRRLAGGSPLPLNTWTHLAATYNGSIYRLYVNGTEVASQPRTGSIATSNRPLRIGGNQVWGEYFAGRIDEVRVYNRALTAAEVVADMALGTAPSAPTLTITSPTNNSTIAGGLINVTFTTVGDLAEANHVRLSLDGGPEQVIAALNGQLELTQVAAGPHTLTGYVARADGTKISGSDAVPIAFSVAVSSPGPQLTITSPANNATLPSGSVLATFATTGDLSEAHHVHLQLDAGPEVMVMALNGSFEFTDVGAGTHSLQGYVVRADHTKIANSDASRVDFTVTGSGPTDPATIGQWSDEIVLPTVAVNLNLLHTGKAILWAGDFVSAPNYGEIWNPVDNSVTPAPNPFANIFCSANVHLADGRLLVAGGHDKQNGILGSAAASVFSPVTESWSSLPSMAFRRWYPTLTTLGDGRALITAGSSTNEDVFVELPEIYNPVTNTWTTLSNARRSIPQYPMMFLLPDGRVLQAGSTEDPTNTAVLNVNTQQWTVVDSRVLDGGSGVMYAPGKIMKTGSSSNDGLTPEALSTATAYVIDMTQPSPQWRTTAPMNAPRTFHNLTSLADGSVIVTSGSRRKSETNLAPAVLEAEIWSPETETWTTTAPMKKGRIYHSTAILLPDGRVAVSGSGNIGGGTDQRSVEIYSPPYLFRGPRPIVSAAPTLVRHGATFTVETPDPASIKAVNLLRPGAATHNFDQDQRFVPLSFTPVAGGLEVEAPADSNVLPPGYYMLFLISNQGVPSVSTFVRFPAGYEDLEPPTAPTNLVVSGGIGSATLTWQAAADNVGVTRYEVHRSPLADFAPNSGTLVGESVTTEFTSTGMASGTYHFAVVAVDATGNRSAPSNIVSVSVTSDASAPTVSITAPANGATVSGAVAINASASDNVSVAGVQFRLDGNVLGAEDTIAPYSVSWLTSTATNGVHTITALARDAAGNQRESSPVIVTVANTAPPVPAGLVASYSFEEGVGQAVADASGNNNTGTISGAAWTAEGRFGSALSFDGVNDRVDIPDASSLDLTRMTIGAWVYPTAVNGYRTVVMKEVAGELAYALYAGNDQGRPEGYVRIGSSSKPVTHASALPVNTWTHLATTYDGTTLRLFINGAQVASSAVTGNIVTSNLPLRIGWNSVWGEYFAGRIDEVRVYNRALSAAEIAADMSPPAPPTPRLAISAPANDATVVGPTVTVTYLSSGDLSGATHARFQLDSLPEISVQALNGQFAISSVTTGLHTLRGYLARADQTAIAGSEATPVQFTVALPDHTQPSVVFTAPRDGDTVTGTFALAATATDNVAVMGVQFKLDGAALGPEDTVAPYTYSWSTSTVTNGTHVLSAVARDAANNVAESLPVNVVVMNTAVPPLAGLVAAYGFEEGTGTVAADSSGAGNAGTISGATWTTDGRFGGALSFDGVNDRVDIADSASLDLTTGMTLEAWVYPTSSGGYRTVVMKEVSGELAYTLYANDGAPRPSSYVRLGGTSRSAAGTSALPLNTWTHLASTYDGATLRVYVNGAQVGSQTMSGSIATSNLALRIGGNAVWGDEYFAGRIDEVRIYNRALSPTEVQTRMNVPVVVGDASSAQPTRSSPIVVDQAARRVWVVNPDSDTVTALHADTLTKQLEVPVGRRPTSVALDKSGQVWVTSRDDDSVWVLDANTGAVREVLHTGWGSAPVSVVMTPDGTAGFVALQGAASVQRVTPQTRTLGPVLPMAGAPHALAVTADSARLLVTRFVSPDSGGEVYSIGVASFASPTTLTLPTDTAAVDGSLAARGVPNYLTGLAVDPAGGQAWVVGKKDNILRGWLRDGQPLTFETTVRAFVTRLDLRGNAEQVSRRIDLDDSSSPSAVALSDSGALAFVAVQGNNRVVVLNQLGSEVVRASTGLAPQGVAVDSVGRRVFTQDLMSRTVSVFDASRLLTQGVAELPIVGQVTTVASESLAPEVLRGKQIFYNAADPRMSLSGYLSCASCHLDGGQDGRVWDFSDRGEGLRNTTSLGAGAGNALAPLHWTGNFDEVQDFENDIRQFFGGTGFMDDGDYSTGTRAQPLGEPKAGLSDDLDALAAYVNSLGDPGFSPYRQSDGALTPGAVNGRALFDLLGCRTCHAGPRFSDSTSGARHDVGTIKLTSGSRAGAFLDGFDTPTLLGLWNSAPYLHDGSARSLNDVLTTANGDGRHGATQSLSPGQIADLVEYLNQLEPGTP